MSQNDIYSELAGKLGAPGSGWRIPVDVKIGPYGGYYDLD